MNGECIHGEPYEEHCEWCDGPEPTRSAASEAIVNEAAGARSLGQRASSRPSRDDGDELFAVSCEGEGHGALAWVVLAVLAVLVVLVVVVAVVLWGCR